MKKIISLFVIAAMAFTNITPAFATDTEEAAPADDASATMETSETSDTDDDVADDAEDDTSAPETDTATSTEGTSATVFTDVEETDESSDAVEYLNTQGVLKGYADGTFKPRATVNRAELMKIMVVGQGIDPDAATYKNCFPDVTDEWFARFVCYAKEQGWVAGYPDGNFYPGKPVNRAEAAKMILNSLEVELDTVSTLYSDVKPGEWYAKYARTIQGRKLLDLPKFDGIRGMTRAEVAIMLYRILVITEQDAKAFAENLVQSFDAKLPVDVIALKNRMVEATTERLAKAKALVDEGIQLGLADDWEGALSKFNSAILLAPRYANAWAGKGYSHYKLQQYFRARFAINVALVHAPLRPIFYAIKSVILLKLNMPNRAFRHLYLAYKMRQALGLTTDPLPAPETWGEYTREELRDLTEAAIEDWAWDEELTEDEWTYDYEYVEEDERSTGDITQDEIVVDVEAEDAESSDETGTMETTESVQ